MVKLTVQNLINYRKIFNGLAIILIACLILLIIPNFFQSITMASIFYLNVYSFNKFPIYLLLLVSILHDILLSIYIGFSFCQFFLFYLLVFLKRPILLATSFLKQLYHFILFTISIEVLCCTFSYIFLPGCNFQKHTSNVCIAICFYLIGHLMHHKIYNKLVTTS